LKPVKGSPTGSEASTVASTVASTIVPAHPSIAPPAASSPAASSPDEEKMPALISEPLDPRGTVIQAKAIKLINLVNAAKIKAGVSTSKQFAFTPFKFDGTQIDDRITMKPEASNKEKAEAAKKNEKPKLKYRFDLTVGSSRTIMKGNHGIDIDKSLDMAIQAIEQDNRLNVDRKTGERTGAGFGDGELDTERIGSSRVIYKSNKGANGVAKGQIYLMLPQLIKGHIRLYNKSGRPVITRSNVSPSFQRIAKDIVERNTFEADDYSTIDPKESADVNKFIEATKPIQPRNINHLSNADTIWQLKKRYEVLVGELSAGNTGKLVRDEMETILRNLIRLHALNIDKGRQLIRSLREF
jgi:hypothetical protein